MQTLLVSALAFSVVATTVCGRGDGGREAATTATGSAPVDTPSTVPGAARPKWPSASCSIVPAADVAGVLGKPVTPRAQDAVHTCDYLTGGSDEISANYWNDKSEFEIMKAQLAKRNAKSTPVGGLGAEAMYGSYGTDGGLAVRLDDGRAFMVVGHDRDHELAVAKLVVAKQ